jgi:signal peptidase I
VWRLLRWGEHVLAATGACLLIMLICFDVSVVVSGSMSPTLQGSNWENGDCVLTEKVSYWLRPPKRWEVVTFRNAEGMEVMKRVVGLPGESVAMRKTGEILINGQPLPRPAALSGIRYYAYGNLLRDHTFPCGTGWYVLGDDSHDSEDSRYEGTIPRKGLIGRAWLIVWPLKRMGFVNAP